MSGGGAEVREHLALAKHLTAETKTEEFVGGEGVVEKWERLRKQNHWFDALYNACAAGHLCGVRLVEEAAGEPQPKPPVDPETHISAADWLHGPRRWSGPGGRWRLS